MATHDGKKHSRKSLRNSPEFRALAELMAGIDPERRGDAFTTAERQDNADHGKEESTADDTCGRTQASDPEFRQVLLSTDGGNGDQSRGDSEVLEERTRYPTLDSRDAGGGGGTLGEHPKVEAEEVGNG